MTSTILYDALYSVHHFAGIPQFDIASHAVVRLILHTADFYRAGHVHDPGEAPEKE